MEHPSIWQWINHNSGLILLVYFPAFCGYMNGVIAFLKVWGLNQAAEFCGKLEDSLKAFVETVKSQNQPPAGGNSVKLSIMILFFVVVLGGLSRADVSTTISVSSVLQSVNIPTTIDQLKTKAVNAGYFYNWKDAKVQPTFTYDVGGAKVLSWGTIDYLDIGYASPDVLVAGPGLSLNVSVIEKKWGITAPTYIQNIINSVQVGFTPMIGLEQIGGKNRFTGGPGGYFKVTW